MAAGHGMSSAPADLGAARRLEVMTLGWNLMEAGVSMGAGFVAGSTALVGFGIDSLVESASGATLLWRLSDRHGEAREARALRLVGLSFLLLAAYVAWEAAGSLLRREPPDASPAGIAIAVASLLVMPWLARRKRQAAARLHSGALAADARQTSLCAYLSAILLAGLALNAMLGWWWADPLCALLMVPIIAREGARALRGERCGDCCAGG
jgi:divalent metal cation (Fe/Co/Zn/Cd) transporter